MKESVERLRNKYAKTGEELDLIKEISLIG